MDKPSIRFKGYTEAWEQRKFSKLVTIERGGSPRPIDKFITKDVNGLNWIKIGDAPEQGNYITHTSEKIIPEGLSKTREVHPGDLILSNSMSFGKPYIMAIDGCIHDGWLLIRDTQKNFDLKFLCILLGTENMLNQYKAMAAGSTVNNLNKELVGCTNISYPSLAEQSKLGEYFEQLDLLITLHQRKCEETKILKKYMLQNMFPQNGSDIPKIRFDGFTNAWEQRKVSDVMSCVTDYVAAGSFSDIRNNVKYLSENGFAQLIRTVDLKNKFTNSDFIYVDENAFNYLWRVNLNEECIILPNIGANIGEVYYVDPSELPLENNVLGPNAILLKTESDNYYTYTLLSSDYFQQQLFENVGSSGQPKFNKTELKNINLMIPDIAEQIKIGKYFKTLDRLITLHQCKYEELLKIKKFMLEKMFV